MWKVYLGPDHSAHCVAVRNRVQFVGLRIYHWHRQMGRKLRLDLREWWATLTCKRRQYVSLPRGICRNKCPSEL